MQNRFAVSRLPFLFLYVLLIFTSCKKTTDNVENPMAGQVAQRPVGQPDGDLYTQNVGVDGGIVKSEDGRITIEIPAGALSSLTEIGIQPLNNTAVSGIGRSYRLTPHGDVFKKQVTIRFDYSGFRSTLSNPEGIEITTQNVKGQWICPGGLVNDTVQKTIEVQTNHFSDWAFIASMELSPVVSTVGPGQSVTLKALRYVFPQQGDDWAVPLALPNTGTGEPLKIEPAYIVKWALSGPGKIESNGPEARYVAPASIPTNNTPATITLELNVAGKKVLLISTIYLVTDGIHISINDQPSQTYAGMATALPDMAKFTIANLRTSEDLPQIVFLLPQVTGQRTDGIYHWSMLNGEVSEVVFEYAEPDLQHMYVSVYDDGNETRDSGGFISVNETEQNGKKYLTGFFSIENAGKQENTTGEQIAIANIKGTFKVQRTW